MSRRKNIQGTTFSYDQTRLRILNHILMHDLRDGDLLPSLRTLAEEFCKGRIKPARMAVALLVDEGVLETQRGRGLFLKSQNLAAKLANSQSGDESHHQNKDADIGAVPFSLMITRPCLKLHLVEKVSPFRMIWSDIAETFNTRQNALRVMLSYGDPPDVMTTDDTGAPDIIQVQSFRIGKYSRADVLSDMAPHLDAAKLRRFYPSLWMTPLSDGQPVWGLPITAVVGCMALNRKGANALKTPVPEHWESFQEYVEFIEAAAKQLVSSRRLDAIVHSTHGMLYHMAIGGVWNGLHMIDIPDFMSPKIREFLSLFGRVFCRPDCYVNAWNSQESPDTISSRTLIYETHTYNYPAVDLRSGIRREFIHLPLVSGGSGILNAHYLAVRKSTPYTQECMQFLDYLMSDEVMARFLQNGHVVGWNGVEASGDEILLEALRRGRPTPEHDAVYDRFVTEVINPRIRDWQLGTLPLDAMCEAIEESRQIWLNAVALQRGILPVQ